MLIGLDRDMTHIDIGVIRSKVKVIRIIFVKKRFSIIILIIIYHIFYIFYMLIGHYKGLNFTNFGHKGHFCKNDFRSFC